MADQLTKRGVFQSVAVSDEENKSEYVLTGSVDRLQEVDYGGAVRAQVTISAVLLDPVRRQVIWSGDCYLVPRPDGEIVLGATQEEGNYDARPTIAGLHALTDALLEIVPAAGSFVVEGAWAGLRPGAPDRRPIIGWAAGVRGLMLATAHYRNGILLGPLTGRLIAREMLGGQPAEELRPFGLERFD